MVECPIVISFKFVGWVLVPTVSVVTPPEVSKKRVNTTLPAAAVLNELDVQVVLAVDDTAEATLFPGDSWVPSSSNISHTLALTVPPVVNA